MLRYLRTVPFCKIIACTFFPVFSAGAAGAGETETGTAQPAPPTQQEEELLKEIEAATSAPPAADGASVPATTPTSATPSAIGGSFLSNKYNPAISLNGLFLGTATNGTDLDEVQTGIAVQELEMQFLSNVDPYFSANLILAMEGGSGLEVEEGYLTLTAQPFGLGTRIGKMKVPFGRENLLHTHALPFIDRSLIGNALFGEEGLNEVGLEESYLTPLPFYTILYASVLNGNNEALFNSPAGRDLVGFTGLKSVLDLTDDTTLEAGLSYALGKNAEERLSQAAGAHLVLKWRPARAATTRSAVVTLEAMYGHRPGADTVEIAENTAGAYAFAQWQLGKRWYAGGRFDYLGMPSAPADATTRESAILVLAPTEFSAIRLQGSVTQPPGGAEQIYEAFLQINFTLGMHPAHAY